MTYTFISAAYTTEDESAAVAITEEAAAVLLSELDNPDQWAALHEWGMPDAYVAPVPPPPTVVSASQAKIALYDVGLLETVKALVANHPYEPVRIWYADANQWERGHAYVQGLGAEIGLTDDDIDALFLAASLL